MSMSNLLRSKLLDHVLGNSLYIPPGDGILRVGLFNNLVGNTADNLAQGIVTDEISVSGAIDYSRGAAVFGNTVDGTISNSFRITFNISGNTWGTITHAAVIDGSSNEVLFWQELDEPITINTAERIEFLPGELNITLD